jgi:TRAP-type C4-dicarboxylate transport system permease large subunit
MIDPTLGVIAASLLLLGLLVVRVPIALALFTAGAVGLVLVEGPARAGSSLARLPYQTVARFTLIIIPLFILMGILAKNGRMASDAYRLASSAFRWMPGGLAIASIAACAGFAAVSGSSIATVASVGRTSVTEMVKAGYDRRFAAGVIGSAGTLGVLIPPSAIIVFYALIAGESVGGMLVAGIVPGILSGLLYCVFIIVRVRMKPSLVGIGADGARLELPTDTPPAASPRSDTATRPTRETAMAAIAREATIPPVESAAEPIESTASPWIGSTQIAVLFIIVIGGIYSGVFTPVESAAVAAFVATAIVLTDGIHRLGGVRQAVTRVSSALSETVSVTAMMFLLLVGGTVFTNSFLLAGVPQSLGSWVIGLTIPPSAVLILMLLLFIPLGMILDPLSIMLIAVPLFHPVATSLGFDGLWFGILIVKMIELSLITPPVGINVFVVAGVCPEVDVADAFRGIAPFALVDLMTVALLVAFPAIVTFLPSLIRG